MRLTMAVGGTYPRSTGMLTFCTQVFAVGVNSQIWFVIAVLIWNPPIVYSLLLRIAKPPGKVIPSLSPGHGALTALMLSVTGLSLKTRAVAVTCPPAEPP